MDIIGNILRKELIDRNVLPGIIKWVPKKEASILLGSRQVGKTCLLYLLIQYLAKEKDVKTKDIFYLDLERLDNLELLNGGVDNLINFIYEQSPKDTKKYIFIDEIQYLDDPSNLIKILVDHHSDKIKIFATGSSALNIKRKFKDSLVGRKITFEVYSLDFREYLLFKKEKNLKDVLDNYRAFDYFKPISNISHNKILNLYLEYAVFGGYPAVTLLKGYAEKKKYLDDIYTSYVRKDINAIFSLENITAFNKVLKILALNIGNLVNIQEISKEIGLARQTVEKYFSILENTYICKFIQPYFTNKRKEIIKMPKVYFYDMGLRNRIINDFRKPDERVDAGALMENAVFKNLLKRTENKENIKFWRMKYGTEVDFIIDEQQILSVEVKAKETESVPVGISSFLKNYKNKKAIVFNKKAIKKQGKVIFLPFYAA